MSDDLVKRLRGGLAIGEEAADRIEEAMYRLHKLRYWLDMDKELFDDMTDQQQADHQYVQTAVDGVIWALKGQGDDRP